MNMEDEFEMRMDVIVHLTIAQPKRKILYYPAHNNTVCGIYSSKQAMQTCQLNKFDQQIC